MGGGASKKSKQPPPEQPGKAKRFSGLYDRNFRDSIEVRNSPETSDADDNTAIASNRNSRRGSFSLGARIEARCVLRGQV